MAWRMPAMNVAETVLRGARRQAVDLFYPKRCSGCGQRGTWLCDACDKALERFSPPWCERCGVPIMLDRCRCGRMPETLKMVRSVGPYDGWIRGAIVNFKYHAEWSRAEHLAGLLATRIQEMPSCDALVPVPLHSARLRERGFNQSLLLALHAAELLGVSVAEPVVRQRRTSAQARLGAVERHANVNGAFVIADRSFVKGMACVLVDDVITTGSTLSACADALYEAGARSVGVATIAREL